MNKKTRITVLCSVLGVLAVTGSIILFSGKSAPDPKTQTPLDIAKYIASDDFSGLSGKDRQKYLNESRELMRGKNAMDSLSDEEKEKFRDNMRRSNDPMKKHMKEYFSLPQDQREEYMKKLIQDMENRRKSGQDRPPDAPPGGGSGSGKSDQAGGPPRTPPSADKIRTRIENESPVERAQRNQFMKDMMQARGR